MERALALSLSPADPFAQHISLQKSWGVVWLGPGFCRSRCNASWLVLISRCGLLVGILNGVLGEYAYVAMLNAFGNLEWSILCSCLVGSGGGVPKRMCFIEGPESSIGLIANGRSSLMICSPVWYNGDAG